MGPAQGPIFSSSESGAAGGLNPSRAALKIGQRVTIRATIVEAFCGRFDLDMKPVFVASAARGRDQWHRIVIRGGSVVGLPLAVPPVIFCPNRTVHHNSMVQLPVYGVVVSIFMLLVSSIQMPA